LGDPDGSRGSAGPRPPPELVVAIGGPMRPGDIRALCETLRRALEGGPAFVVCDLAPTAEPDLSVVDALARVLLTAQRSGRPVRVEHACSEFRGLLDLTGLTDLLGLDRQAGREAEQREPPRGVEEEGDPGDPGA
jgi:STAS domain